MSQPLPHEKWEDLKELYGDNAYLMCEYLGSRTMNWCDYCHNQHVQDHIDGYDYFQERRVKNSASLPFDFKQASDNCEVEAINPRTKQWETVRFLHGGTSIEIEYLDNNQIVFVTANDLRMKYPLKPIKVL